MKKAKKKSKKKIIISLIAAVVVIAVAIQSSLIIYSSHKRFSVKDTISLSDVFTSKSDSDKIHLTAHRGLSSQAPENTVPSIEKAAEYGFNSIEIDIRQTQDGVWVLSHDANVNNTTNKMGKISSYTYYDLVTCTIDKGANIKEYANLKIPTLEQALDSCLENNITPMIEIKDYTQDGLTNLINIIDKYSLTQSCTIISFDRDALNFIRKSNEDIKLAVLVKELSDKEIKTCLETPDIGVSFNGNNSKSNEKTISKLKSAGISLTCWTIDEPNVMETMYHYGITEFVSNLITY